MVVMMKTTVTMKTTKCSKMGEESGQTAGVCAIVIERERKKNTPFARLCFVT